jgi:signal transduction histidine kinase
MEGAGEVVFLDDVQQFLRESGTTPTAPRRWELPPGFDLAGRREQVWRVLEAMEQSPRGSVRARWEFLCAWSVRPQAVEDCVRRTGGPFFAGLGRRLSLEQQHALMDHALTELLWDEVRPCAGQSDTTLQVLREGYAPLYTPVDLTRWCDEHLLIDRVGSTTGLGRLACVLRGGDAVEFLLAVGVELAVSPADPHRIGEAWLRALLEGPVSCDPDFETPLRRLADLGPAQREEPHPAFERFTLHPASVPMVRRVLDPDSRFRSLARTALEAERGLAVDGVVGRPVQESTDAHYARSVAHEVRNLLLPLQTAVGGLWEELGSDRPDLERRSALRGRIERALGRLADFASETVKLSTALVPETLRLADVVAVAIEATAVERNGRIEVSSALREERVVGARQDWTHAFTNLLRNAAQVRKGSGTVWVSAFVDDAGGLHLYVDDDGPGVPVEQREQVFELGYSLHGGGGFGLASARRAAHLAGGTLQCEDAPQGGARFHFTLPRRSVG